MVSAVQSPAFRTYDADHFAPGDGDRKRLQEFSPALVQSPSEVQRIDPGSTTLMAAAVPRQRLPGGTVDVITYSAVGINAPLTGAAQLTGKLLEKIPRAGPALSRLVSDLGKLSGDKSDILRIEYNADSQGGTVVHLKLNAKDLAQMSTSTRNAVFDRLSELPGAEKQVRAFERTFARLAPAIGQSKLAGVTDVRLTLDPFNRSNGVRIGMLSYAPLGSYKGFDALVAASPRAKFDGNGKLVGGQLIVAFEVDSPSTKIGKVWGGFGTALVFQWDGSIANSKVRKDASGKLGLEIEFEGKKRFLEMDGLRTAILPFGSVSEVKESKAPRISGAEIAVKQTGASDPKVLQAINDGVQIANKTGNFVSAANELGNGVAEALALSRAVPGPAGWLLALGSLYGSAEAQVRRDYYQQVVAGGNYSPQKAGEFVTHTDRVLKGNGFGNPLGATSRIAKENHLQWYSGAVEEGLRNGSIPALDYYKSQITYLSNVSQQKNLAVDFNKALVGRDSMFGVGGGSLALEPIQFLDVARSILLDATNTALRRVGDRPGTNPLLALQKKLQSGQIDAATVQAVFAQLKPTDTHRSWLNGGEYQALVRSFQNRAGVDFGVADVAQANRTGRFDDIPRDRLTLGRSVDLDKSWAPIVDPTSAYRR